MKRWEVGRKVVCRDDYGFEFEAQLASYDSGDDTYDVAYMKPVPADGIDAWVEGRIILRYADEK